VTGLVLFVFGGLALGSCGRRGVGFYKGERGEWEPLARHVAGWVEVGVDASNFHTGGARFDGEWALGTYQMAALGLGQVALEHPELAEELRPVVADAAEALLEPGLRSFGTAAWGDDALEALETEQGHAYMGYLNMALGMHRLLEPDTELASTHDALTEALARRLAAAPTALIETYPGEAYPVDVASVAASIALHARATGADRDAMLEAWSERYRELYVDPVSGLLIQAADPATGNAWDRPRGSGTALAVYFTAFVDADLSADLYEGLTRSCRVMPLGYGGMREYERGTSGWGDVDSGPVIFGVGTSATGFALAGARLHGDRPTYQALFRTASLCGAPLHAGNRHRFLVGGSLGNAILLAMMTAGPGTVVGDQSARS
jgi:hypothetical protein